MRSRPILNLNNKSMNEVEFYLLILSWNKGYIDFYFSVFQLNGRSLFSINITDTFIDITWLWRSSKQFYISLQFIVRIAIFPPTMILKSLISGTKSVDLYLKTQGNLSTLAIIILFNQAEMSSLADHLI